MARSEWIDRHVRGPEHEFLDRSEFRKLFSLSEETLDELLNSGILPQPMRPTKRTVLFGWEHAVLVNLWMKLGGRLPSGNGHGGRISPPDTPVVTDG